MAGRAISKLDDGYLYDAMRYSMTPPPPPTLRQRARRRLQRVRDYFSVLWQALSGNDPFEGDY